MTKLKRKKPKQTNFPFYSLLTTIHIEISSNSNWGCSVRTLSESSRNISLLKGCRTISAEGRQKNSESFGKCVEEMLIFWLDNYGMNWLYVWLECRILHKYKIKKEMLLCNISGSVLHYSKFQKRLQAHPCCSQSLNIAVAQSTKCLPKSLTGIF